MKKILTKKNIIIFCVTAFIFSITTIIANKYLNYFTVSSLRISAAMNPICGILFGWPAIFGCAIGNLISDIISGYKAAIYVQGVFEQIVYGFIPYILWRKFIKSSSHFARLDNIFKVLVLIAIIVLDCIFIGLYVGWLQFLDALLEHKTIEEATQVFMILHPSVFLNDLCACIFVGFPMMAIYDWLYSKIKHKGRRKISFNEIVLLMSTGLQVITFITIAIILNNTKGDLELIPLWNKIFTYSVVALFAYTVLSMIVMFVAYLIRKKHAGLRIIEKPNGTIFVDEQKKLEFVSFPGTSLEYRVKSDALGYSLENAQKRLVPTYESGWYTLLSNQKGCPMKCMFCDAPGYGYYGNVSRDDLNYQIKTIIENTGTTFTRYFKVDFMRLGEPTLNNDILDFIEFDLKNTIRSKVDSKVIVPTISTMMPKNKEMVSKYLKEYCRIKNEVYNGNAELQISINTTNEIVRKFIFRNMTMSLKEISDVCKELPMPLGNKYMLNFPVNEKSIIEPEVIDKLFDKNKFCIKLTPYHNTFNALDNGFTTKDASDYKLYGKFEKAFEEIGWDVLVYLDKKEEDEDSLTCGNLLLPHIQEKFGITKPEVKRVGIVVAIELDAIYTLYKNVEELGSPQGFKVLKVERDDYNIYICQSGLGECAASAATQYLISKFNVRMVINFGVVGGLTKAMSKLKVCLVEKVVHYKYDCSEFMPLVVGQVDGYDSIYIKANENLVKNAKTLMPELNLVTCCSGDKFIGTATEKMYLHETFNGDICDMESAGILLTCEANKVPCIMFKAVSDGLSDGAEGFYKELLNASTKCLEIADRILDKIANIEK